MSLSNHLQQYMSDCESGEITTSDEEGPIVITPTKRLVPAASTLQFSAHFSKCLSKVLPYHAIIFNKVEKNIDKVYDKRTGRFTAPFKGIYVFFVTMTSAEKVKSSICFIRKSDPVLEANVKEMIQTVGSFESKTVAVVLSLDKDGTVWVMNTTKPSDMKHIEDTYYTSFSGGLVEKQSAL